MNPAELRRSHNVAVFATADHDDLKRRASLVLTHGGHGTFMRALKNGLSVVVVAGLGADQPINAAAAEDWRVGRAIPNDATAEMVRDAVKQVLDCSAYRERAVEISTKLAMTAHGSEQSFISKSRYFFTSAPYLYWSEAQRRCWARIQMHVNRERMVSAPAAPGIF